MTNRKKRMAQLVLTKLRQIVIYGNNILLWSGTKCIIEYINYTRRMTEIYNEYAKSSQRMTQLYKELAANAEKMTELYKESANSTEKMTKYWFHFLRTKPMSKNKE